MDAQARHISSSFPIPYAFAKEHGLLMVPQADHVELFYRPGCSPLAIMEARRKAGRSLALKSTSVEDFDQLLQSTYNPGKAGSIAFIESMEETLDLSSLAARLPEKEDVLSQESEAPIIRMINALLMEALQQKASDVHIETTEAHVIVRFRVDGVLREIIRLKRVLASRLISRIKIMARLDIAEKRLPQDGHITLKSANHEFDIRVSTIPSANAERIVLRLLDKEANKLKLSRLGMNDRDLTLMQQIVRAPHGIVLVTGPTGSGKSTTLYAALSELNDGKSSILTIEDPIELNIDGIGQTEVNTKVEMTFARGLRAILRQDPDIIMVGEIRDNETAEIAVQASLTGHLVFSTLHTNSAIGAIPRLHDMKIEPYLLASSLIGLVAQRLVRKLCDHCKRAEAAQPHECIELGLPPTEQVFIYHMQGCEHCKHTGYSGRIGIYEVIRIDSGMQQMIHDRASEAVLENYARLNNPSMMHDARQKIIDGLTSLEEVHRVITASHASL